MSTQTDVAKAALTLVETFPVQPTSGTYLSESEAYAIVEDTLRLVRETADEVKIAYLTGHRRRLVETLKVVPKAPHEGATFLDIGCYGYFGLWACTHLGYASATGTEMPLPEGEVKQSRTVTLGDVSIEMDVFYFDLTDENWPIEETFDTAICLEVLEHVDHDPAGVLGRLRDRIVMGGNLVFSVPNGVSYKTLDEMYSGMPPWTYWFYNPDLSHEPRHALEYTPFTNALMLRAAGFEQRSFTTIDAYREREDIADLYEIGEMIGLETRYFGETMISTAVKTRDEAEVRFPDAIYSPDGYYASTWPLVAERRRAATEGFLARQHDLTASIERMGAQTTEMRHLLDAYETALAARDNELNAARAELANIPEKDRKIMLYRLLSPANVAAVAESGALPKRGHWKRVFKRHPLKVSLWRSLKRLHRRMKTSENQAAWKKISNSD